MVIYCIRTRVVQLSRIFNVWSKTYTIFYSCITKKWCSKTNLKNYDCKQILTTMTLFHVLMDLKFNTMKAWCTICIHTKHVRVMNNIFQSNLVANLLLWYQGYFLGTKYASVQTNILETVQSGNVFNYLIFGRSWEDLILQGWI